MYLAQYTENNHHKNINEIFYIFSILSWKSCASFTLISHFGLATFQVFNGYMWLVATILDHAAIEHLGHNHSQLPELPPWLELQIT